MRHQQILDKLAAGAMAPTIRDEVRMLARKSFWFSKHKGLQGAQYQDVVPALLERWGFLLNAIADTGEANEAKRMNGYKVAIALATSLHEVGLADDTITRSAIEGVRELNDGVWLSDAFLRQSDEIITLLRSDPPQVSRAPSVREVITFTRPGDVLAIRVREHWVVGHVLAVSGPNQHPYIEFYERVFTTMPDASEVVGTRAWGRSYVGREPEITHFFVSGLRHVPDPAEQIHLIAAANGTWPDNAHLIDVKIDGVGADLYEFLKHAESVAEAEEAFEPASS